MKEFADVITVLCYGGGLMTLIVAIDGIVTVGEKIMKARNGK